MISPDLTETEGLVAPPEIVQMLIAQTPMGRLGQPEDVANAVLMLAMPESHWITGQVIQANGGILFGLNTWQTRGATPAPRGHPGLYHLAVRYPSRRDLAVAVRRVLNAHVPIQGATDHGVSESVYLSDPDGNGVELTCDRPENEWPRNAQGEPDMFSGKPLDLARLLSEGQDNLE